MSQLPVDGVDLCDNLPSTDAVAAQTPNLNETNTLTQHPGLCPSQIEVGGGRRPIQKASFNNNGKDAEEKQGRGREEEDEEEDNDEVMKEEEEESEESSSLIRGQSPDTMTDSSYSETGSLLETPFPFSPGTSAEPTSPVIPAVSPETAYPITPVEFNQSVISVDSLTSSTGSGAFTTGPILSTTLTATTDTSSTSPTGPPCVTETTDRTAKSTESTAELLTSSTQPVVNHGSASSHVGPVTSAAEAFTVTDSTTRLNTSMPSTAVSATTGPLASTTEPTTTGTDLTFTTGSITSNWEHITSTPVPAFFSVSTCSTGTIPSPALLKYLEQLAQKGDDSHLPDYLHQIAEAFVLQKDYQQALRCIQLERLYHQRILDNLNTLQEQWESQCKRTSSDLATEHLDTLKHICQTHSRPSSRDAVRASLDVLRPTVEEGAALPSCLSADQVEREKEQREKDPCPQSGDPVTPSINLTDTLILPEISDKDRVLEERDGFPGSQLTDEQGSDSEGGEAEGGLGHTIPAIENGLHPSTAGEMDQSKPAEQQGGDLGLAEGKEVKGEEEERSVEEAAEPFEMDDEGEEDDQEKQKERDFAFCQSALPGANLGSGAEVEELHQELPAEEELHEHTQQESTETSLHQEVHLTQEAHINQQEQHEEEEEEFEYEVEQADLIREAASLDNMAKLITVEETSPASGLVSILKKRSVDSLSVRSSSEPRPDKPTAKRRVRFRVPDDDEQDVGGGDSCLLLFLLCLVTVVISVGGTALYCALGDPHSSVCQDFSRNADFYFGQIQLGITHIQHWFTPGS